MFSAYTDTTKRAPFIAIADCHDSADNAISFGGHRYLSVQVQIQVQIYVGPRNLSAS